MSQTGRDLFSSWLLKWKPGREDMKTCRFRKCHFFVSLRNTSVCICALCSTCFYQVAFVSLNCSKLSHWGHLRRCFRGDYFIYVGLCWICEHAQRCLYRFLDISLSICQLLCMHFIYHCCFELMTNSRGVTGGSFCFICCFSCVIHFFLMLCVFTLKEEMTHFRADFSFYCYC